MSIAAVRSLNAQILPLSSSQQSPDILLLDEHTIKDLEVFETESGEDCLFEFCDHSRTKGGSKVLRRRMERPWCNADRIRATQGSISFILTQWQAFLKLPTAYAASSVDYYLNEILPVVTQENWVEFSLGAFSLWASNDRDYYSIVRGVQATCALVRALRRFVDQDELISPQGELVPLFEEMRELLASSRLSRVPNHEIGNWGAWKILRFDQLFRVLEKVAITRLLRNIYEIDALVTMASVTRKHEFVLPEIKDGPLRVNAEGLVHPFVHNAVPNPVELSQERRVLFLTGPNMAGKTTYLRAFATAYYFAHLGMGVPARQFSFVPAQCLFSSISLSDNLRGGVSYFRAEALRVKAIAQAVAQGHRVVALMDEPFKGTNVKDALDASLAILERFSIRDDCLFMFSSHLIELQERLNASSDQIDCRYFEAQEGEGRLCFNYLLRSGVSSQRLGMRVLHEEGVFQLLDGEAVDV